VFVTGPGDYGALATGNGPGQNPNGVPGIAFQTAPYSPNVNNLNNTAYNNNLAVFTAGTGGYSPYTNQPGYMTTTASGAFSDLITAGHPLPGSTVGADLTDWTLLGNLNYDAKTRAAGSVLAFTSGIDNSPINFNVDVQELNRAALVSFLTNLLNNGYTSATFMIVEKNVADNDPLPRRADNLVFASKEFQPSGGFVGQYAPFMVIAPEPGSMLLAAVGGMTLLRRKRA
jgi:hypothetical protein